jgi:uncharacterized protein YhaN
MHENPILPFRDIFTQRFYLIFDDLLINSDDVRASAALQVFRDLAKRTQVLFFTHHRRLADLGTKAGAQLIELGSSAGEPTV